jgi:hypothetical protein
VLIASPLAIDGGFSHFKTGLGGQVWWRGIIESWLWVGQTFGAIFGFLIPYISLKWQDIRNDKRLLVLSLFLIVLTSLAILGYVVIGLMLKDYGNCMRLY